MSTEEEIKSSPSSTYDWLCANPLATSCGGAICSFYSVSKNYNRMTSWTFGTVESVFGYASEKARPYVDVVADRFDGPMETVDSFVAEELKKLEVKYPIISRPPNEIATEGKNVVSAAFQCGQEHLSKTRAGSLFGYGVDTTLNMTEGLVDKVLPPLTTEDKEEDEEDIPEEDEKQPVVNKTSWFGLRKRKSKTNEEKSIPIVKETTAIDPVFSRSDRIRNLSYSVYYRTLTRVRDLQKEVYVHLQRLKTSLSLLQYAQTVRAGIDKQKQNVAQALHDADVKIREYFSQRGHGKSNEEFAAWLSDEDSTEDINWLLRSNEKKDVFHASLNYAKSLSGKVLDMLRSLSSATGFFPTWFHDGINNGVQQVQDVYSTLVLNNVPSELPSYLLTQVVEIVETQLIFCKKIGSHLSSALKSRFGYTSVDGDDQSDTSSQGVSEVRLDAVEEEKEEEEGEKEKESSEEEEKEEEEKESSDSDDSSSSDESNN